MRHYEANTRTPRQLQPKRLAHMILLTPRFSSSRNEGPRLFRAFHVLGCKRPVRGELRVVRVPDWAPTKEIGLRLDFRRRSVVIGGSLHDARQTC